MGKWSALAVSGLVLIIFVLVSRATISVQLVDDNNSPLSMEQRDAFNEDWNPHLPDLDSDNCSTSVDGNQSFKGHEWRQISVGNNTTGEVPWWAYAIIGITLAGGTIMIVWSSFYYRRKRNQVIEKSLRASEAWKEHPRSSKFSMYSFIILFAMFISFAISMRIQIEVEWELKHIALLYSIITICFCAPFLYLFSSAVGIDFEHTWKRLDKPLDDVTRGIEAALERKAMSFHRMSPEGYKENGANLKVRKSAGSYRSEKSNVIIYDLNDGDQILVLREWSRGSETRVDVLLYFDKDKDDLFINGLTKEIDWELRD